MSLANSEWVLVSKQTLQHSLVSRLKENNIASHTRFNPKTHVAYLSNQWSVLI